MASRTSVSGQAGGVTFAGSEAVCLGDVVGRDKVIGLDEAKVTRLFARMLWSVRSNSSAHHDPAVALQALLAERTIGFVGRRFLFDAVDRFCADNPRGYFIIRGLPGVGKTSFAAELVRSRGLAHHFNIRQEGRTSTSLFVHSICRQLITRHQLPVESIPEDAGRDASFFKYILELCRQRLAPGERLAIVIDALDEADATPPGVNPLHLPIILPPSCYIIITTRPWDDRGVLPARFECEQESFLLDTECAANRDDIREFLRQRVASPKMQAYCNSKRKTSEQVISELEQASEGNFMYLRYVLPEIEAGRYSDTDTAALPIGLVNYYREHWALMRGAGGADWYDLKLPVIAAVTVVRSPVSVQFLSELSHIRSKAKVRDVLREWAAFLEESNEPGGESRYRIYHASFHDFLATQPEVHELNVVENRLADAGLEQYGIGVAQHP